MNKTCQNCGYIRKLKEITSEEECPQCGVYYKKSSLQKASSEINNPQTYGYWQSFIEEVKGWCVERIWIVRVPIVLYLIYLLYVKLSDWQGYTIFDGINLGIHEIGHPLFSFFGRFMTIAGGSILQCLCPMFAMIVLGKQRDYFGITFCIGWLATNLISISVYMYDATDLELTLVTIGGGSGEAVPKEDMHDWHLLFEYFGLLTYDKLIGNITYWIGILMLGFSIALGVILINWMIKLKKEDIKQE